MQTVSDHNGKMCKGIFYDMDFPWSEDTLALLGPAWLTKAFHKAGTMDEDNEVVSVKIERKVTAGNNAGKRL